MISTQHSTDCIGTFTVRLIWSKSVLMESVQYTSVHRLETVPYIGERTGNNYRHSVVEHRVLHLVNKLGINYLGIVVV